MTVYIDPPTWPGHGQLWSHLISDRSYQELHDFAARIGIPSRGFERDHYDVIAERYAAAVAEGAQPVSSRRDRLAADRCRATAPPAVPLGSTGSTSGS